MRESFDGLAGRDIAAAEDQRGDREEAEAGRIVERLEGAADHVRGDG